jgi:hypothetical protein
MRDALAAIPKNLRKEVLSMWCDSKHGAAYSIAVRSDNIALARDMALAFTAAFIQVSVGFNSLAIHHNETWGAELSFVDPTWPDEMMEMEFMPADTAQTTE